MSAPKVVEILSAPESHVIVCTETDGARYSWTVSDREIFGGGIISADGIETEDHNTYRRDGDKWQSYASEKESQEVSDDITAHLDLVEQAVANYKTSGRVQ
jgi:hypothetical protein